MGSEKLLVATRNAGKLKELTALLSGAPFELVSLTDVGIDEDVEETGSTMEENATLKATTYARLSGMPTLADDSGLEVEALGGEPGVFSARYAGEGASDAQRIDFLHMKLQGIPEDSWNARFRCVIAIVWPLRQALRMGGVRRDTTEGVGQGRPSEPVELYTGECYGMIIKHPRGSNGFGYDPAFLIPELGKTMAELSNGEKNRLSHRSMAAQKAAAALRQRAAKRERY